MVEARPRVESAEKALQAAKLDKSKEKAALVKTAQVELRCAKANLKYASGSDEMRRLQDGFDLHIAQMDVDRAQGKVNAAELWVKRWKVFLKWIDAQYPAIAAECGHPTDDSDDDVSQLLGKRNVSRKQTLRSWTRRKGAQSKSVISPVSFPRISKPTKRKADRCHKTQPMCCAVPSLTAPQQRPPDSQNSLRRSKRLQQRLSREPEMSALKPVHSSRVTEARATSQKPGRWAPSRRKD